MPSGCGVERLKTESGKTTDLYDSALRCGLIIRRSEGFFIAVVIWTISSVFRYYKTLVKSINPLEIEY